MFLLFGGTFLPSPPPWFVWLKWISPINYTFAALVQNEFKGQPLACDTPTDSGCYNSVSLLPGMMYAHPRDRAERQGDGVINAYNSGVFTIAENVGFMFALTALFLVAGYLFLRYTAGPRLRFK